MDWMIAQLAVGIPNRLAGNQRFIRWRNRMMDRILAQSTVGLPNLPNHSNAGSSCRVVSQLCCGRHNKMMARMIAQSVVSIPNRLVGNQWLNRWRYRMMDRMLAQSGVGLPNLLNHASAGSPCQVVSQLCCGRHDKMMDRMIAQSAVGFPNR